MVLINKYENSSNIWVVSVVFLPLVLGTSLWIVGIVKYASISASTVSYTVFSGWGFSSANSLYKFLKPTFDEVLSWGYFRFPSLCRLMPLNSELCSRRRRNQRMVLCSKWIFGASLSSILNCLFDSLIICKLLLMFVFQMVYHSRSCHCLSNTTARYSCNLLYFHFPAQWRNNSV